MDVQRVLVSERDMGWGETKPYSGTAYVMPGTASSSVAGQGEKSSLYPLSTEDAGLSLFSGNPAYLSLTHLYMHTHPPPLAKRSVAWLCHLPFCWGEERDWHCFLSLSLPPDLQHPLGKKARGTAVPHGFLQAVGTRRKTEAGIVLFHPTYSLPPAVRFVAWSGRQEKQSEGHT